MNVDIKGLHIDSIAGKADLMDFKILYNDKTLALKEIHLAADKVEQNRALSLRTNLINADVKGNFLLSDITHDVQMLVEEMVLNLENNKQDLEQYYSRKSYRPKTYAANFEVEFVDIEPIVELLQIDLNVSQRSRLDGRFMSGYTSVLQAFSHFDSIVYNKTTFLGTDLELNASKIADSTNVLAMLSINSEKQLHTKKFSTKNVMAEAIWNKNHIDFGFDADQEGQSNSIRLLGAVDFFKDSTRLHLKPSTVKILEKVWQFDDDNYITIAGKNITVRELTMHNESQFISAFGMVSPDPDKKLSLLVKNLDLSLLNPITGRNVSGTLNALFDVSDYYADPFVENALNIDSLTFDNFLIGDIEGKNQWDNVENKFLLDFHVDRQQTRIVNLEGVYDPSDKENPLDVDAKLTNANLRILQPFLEDIFSNIGGVVTGDFKIGGRLEEPAISGEGQIINGQVMISYLKTVYKFSGTAGMTPRSIYFRDITLTDILNNNALLNGTIHHKNFYSMRINIDASFESFQVLNTSARDNSLFYGQGYATGDLNIFGPVDNLKITANARTDKNTRIYIPITGNSEVERKEFIKFVDFSDSTFQKSLVEEVANKIELTGVTLDFNLDVTPDAYCEIIIDLKAGDIIRGRGNGELQLQYDTKGEFNMFGPFEFTEGYYNFTLADIINKDFEIKKGSRITWYGDAYEGVLDISASYNQLASFMPLLSPDLQRVASSQMKRKYPAQVLLDIDGPMLTPQINFDIVAMDLPQNVLSSDNRVVRLDFEFQTFKNRMDEQELKRQVFSLIVLRRFSPPDAFNTSGSIANSVSELLSNQLSNWVSQVDENLEIDFDLSGFDNDAFNTLQMRMRYSIGRWVITRDATTTLSNNTQNPATGAPVAAQQNNFATIAGDWTVEYLLTADGKLKVKMYNRNNVNPLLTSITNQNTVTTGVSLLHVQNFNELKDLWRSARNKRKPEEPETETESESEQGSNKNTAPGPNQDAVIKREDGTE